MSLKSFSSSPFRLSIPPFVQARTVLEGLQREDPYEDENKVKEEMADTKVKEYRGLFDC